MDKPLIKEHTFDFSGIFPECREGFSWKFNTPRGDVANKLTNLCSDFNKKFRNDWISSTFSVKCQLVTYYLKHIKDQGKENMENSCCKYFFYKLKDLLNDFPCTCGDSRKCYDAMKSLSSDEEFHNQVSPLFLQCSDYPNHLDEETFKIFKKADVIYDKLNELRIYESPNASAFIDFKNEMKFLERYQNTYDESLSSLLKYFNESIEKYLKSLDPNGWGVSGFISYLKRLGYIKEVIKRETTDPEIHAIRSMDTERYTSTDINTDIGTHINTGICVLFFAILIIIFILYKYTPFGSYIQPRARRVKKLMKRKNKECMRLNDSYEMTYNKLNDKQYEIAYR